MAKIKIDDALWTRVKEHATAMGYASPEEFVTHVLENALVAGPPGTPAAGEEEEIKKRLQGLGYIA